MQGGLDWELIAMVAAAASGGLIGWDWLKSRGGAVRSEAAKGLLEVAWPVLFIAIMGLMLKFTDFAAVLLVAAIATGCIWLADSRIFAKRRGPEAARRGIGGARGRGGVRLRGAARGERGPRAGQCRSKDLASTEGENHRELG